MKFFYTGQEAEAPLKRTYIITPYTYPVTFLRALSGDRFTARIHVGFGWSIEQIVQIKNVKAPLICPEVDEELTKRGTAARDYVQRKLAESQIFITTDRPVEYGRVTGLVRVINSWSYGRVVDFGEMLIEAGMCVPVKDDEADAAEVR